ncbi:MAG: hypothetical protein BMS9Abin29_0849 [Gemmatimonadota bacterium]|nr:MAG: hypothetical protein BMS9Abin29_0849 [Gemmatimonadota bacterium]
MDEVRIPNQATYAPVALTDVFVLAPLASRVLLGATLPGRVLQAVALGAYAGSAVSDWISRREARPIDFEATFGADVDNLTSMTDDEREAEVEELVAQLNANYEPMSMDREELAELVNEHLTDHIASITGQRVETSSEIRSFSITKVIFPFALGACDMLTGDVTIFRDTGVFEPHIIAHEFCHRKGYIKELEAQALAYMALAESEENILVQAAQCERVHRNLRVLAEADLDRYHELADHSGLREELVAAFHAIRPTPSAYERGVWAVMKPIFEERMRMTGQNGISDYDVGFTDFIHSKK